MLGVVLFCKVETRVKIGCSIWNLLPSLLFKKIRASNFRKMEPAGRLSWRKCLGNQLDLTLWALSPCLEHPGALLHPGFCRIEVHGIAYKATFENLTTEVIVGPCYLLVGSKSMCWYYEPQIVLYVMLWFTSQLLPHSVLHCRWILKEILPLSFYLVENIWKLDFEVVCLAPFGDGNCFLVQSHHWCGVFQCLRDLDFWQVVPGLLTGVIFWMVGQFFFWWKKSRGPRNRKKG